MCQFLAISHRIAKMEQETLDRLIHDGRTTNMPAKLLEELNRVDIAPVARALLIEFSKSCLKQPECSTAEMAQRIIKGLSSAGLSNLARKFIDQFKVSSVLQFSTNYIEGGGGG